MIQASCHCGNVTIEMAREPENLTSCNCSICNRLGALWSYYKLSEVKVECKEPTKTYCQGDKYLNVHHCPNCGCTTHYTPTEKNDQDRMAVNYRMVDFKLMEKIPVRRFDGADTWAFIDD